MMTQTLVRRRARFAAALLLALGVAVLLSTVFGGTTKRTLRGDRAAIPFPILIYEIEAKSGSRTASLLNLKLPNVGAPQVPIPVDINGDLLPDVTVAVNLVNVEGVFNNPPQLGKVIAPNIEINRLFTAPLLTPGGDPLRINIKLTLKDLEGKAPDMVVRYGYDTGPGGSIPPTYKALLGGLDNFFNPLEAVIDTTGGLLIGIDPSLANLGLTPQSSAYQGPLTTFVQLDNGPDLSVKADLRFKPMPDAVRATYGWGDDGQHITIAHSETGEVDLEASAKLHSGDLDADVLARIDRMPRRIALDLLSGDDGGGIQYTSDATSGRLPDLSATAKISGVLPSPLVARVDLESVPTEMGGTWRMEEGAPPKFEFNGSGQGIGAIEAHIWNYDGPPTGFTPWVSDTQQHVSIQSATGGFDGDLLLQARLERLRSATFEGHADGSLTGDLQVGDGERPLKIHAEVDLRSQDLPYLGADALVAPLPNSLRFAMVPPGEDAIADPMTIRWEPSSTIDVDVDATVALPGSPAAVACGSTDTLCAALQLRHVPALIEARMGNVAGESRIEVDSTPKAGAGPLDLFAQAVLGPITTGGALDSYFVDPIRAELSVLGLPDHLRVRTVQVSDTEEQRVDVRTCDLDYETGLCIDEDPNDKVAEMTFDVRNFETRPAGMPAPPASSPLHFNLIGRGDGNTALAFQAEGRVTDFKQLTYLSDGQTTGMQVDVGDGQDFRAFVDVDDLGLGLASFEGALDIDADVRINPVPAPTTFCFTANGRDLSAPVTDPITAACESATPFGDDGAASGPMTVAFRAPGTFDVLADLAVSGDLPLPDLALPVDFGTFDRVGVRLAMTNLPGELTAEIATPADATAAGSGLHSAATRILTYAPGANDTTLDLSAAMTTAGVSCTDPDPDGGAVCASIVVDQLPEWASVLAETVTEAGTGATGDAIVSQNVRVDACDVDVAGTGQCRPGTAQSIKSIDVDVRAHAGTGAEVPTVLPPADEPHLFAQAVFHDLANFEVVASARLEELRHVSFRQDPDGLQAASDMGDGIDPLTIHAYADLRTTDNLVPEALRAEVIADLQISPLPAALSFTQQGPGPNQADPMTMTFEASSEALVTMGAQIHEAGGGGACGTRGSICADLVIDTLPSHLAVGIERTSQDVDPFTRTGRALITVHQERFANPSKELDITASVSAGLPVDLPVVGDGPIFADLALVGIPDHLTVNLDTTENLHEVGGDLVVESAALDRFGFFTCQRDLVSEACAPGTEGDIDAIEVSVRTFDLRPTDFPAPPADASPLYVSVAGRGEDLELYAHLSQISEVEFVNAAGLMGARFAAGGTTPAAGVPLQVRVDVDDFPLGESLILGDLDLADPVASLRTSVDIEPFPGEVAFCMREGGQDAATVTGPGFTDRCTVAEPFGPGSGGAEAPLSIGFEANVPFDVAVEAVAELRGVDAVTGDPADPRRVEVAIDVDDVPSSLDLHLLRPAETLVDDGTGPEVRPTGPMRLLIDTAGADTTPDQLDLEVSAAYLVGESTVCKDPRPYVTAVCVHADIDNLPSKVELLHDPTLDLSDPAVDLADPAAVENFYLRTEGSKPTEISLDLSLVSPTPLLGTDLGLPIDSNAVVIEAQLSAITHPLELRGTVDLGGNEEPPTIDIRKTQGTLPSITLDLRNFIAPDPTAGIVVADRPVVSNGKATYTTYAIQRGGAVRAHAEIPEFTGVTLRPVRGVDHLPTGTTAMRVAVSDDFNIRAYLDLQPDPGTSILADLVLHDVPAAVSVCMRPSAALDGDGLVPVATPAYPGTGTWCDASTTDQTAPVLTDLQSVLQVSQEHNTPGRKLDVDAFARLQYAGGAAVVAGRLVVQDLPHVLRAELPSADNGDLEIDLYSYQPITGMLVPDGVDKVAIEASTFDLSPAAAGFTGALPYDPIYNNREPFASFRPDPVNRQFLHAAADLTTGHAKVKALIGDPGSGPASQLQSVHKLVRPCPAPVGYDGFLPYSPTDDGTQYTCIRAAFDEASAGVDPLDMWVRVTMPDGKILQLRDAGLSDIPDWVQIQLADAEHYTDPLNKRGWRRPCGSVTDEPGTGNGADCMAPLLQFNQPSNIYLFGVAEMARPGDLGLLDTVNPSPGVEAPNFNAVPSATGWGASPTDERGLMVKALVVDDAGLLDAAAAAADNLALRAAFRLLVPSSLTIDQIQKFDIDGSSALTQVATEVEGRKDASDLRFHLTMRNPNGSVVDKMGELGAMLHMTGPDLTVLASKPCPINVAQETSVSDPMDCVHNRSGITLPGEAGLAIYKRTLAAGKIAGSGDKHDSTMFQVDGRISAPMDIGLRVLPKDTKVIEGVRLGRIDLVLRNLPAIAGGADPGKPSFRLRAEMLSDATEASTPATPDDAVESETVEGGEEPGGTKADIVWYTLSFDIRLKRFYVGFDFEPQNDDRPARRVDAVIYTSGAEFGADVASFADVTGSVPAPISAGMRIDFDKLNIDFQLGLNFREWATSALDDWLRDEIGGFGAKVVGFLLRPLIWIVDAALRNLRLEGRLDSDIVIEFELDRTETAQIKSNVLHMATEATGPAGAHIDIGPINWMIRDFFAGLTLKLPSIPIPWPISWIVGKSSIKLPSIPLLGYGYMFGLNAADFGLPNIGPAIMMDFRDCGVAGFGGFLPYSGSGLSNAWHYDANQGERDFVMWVGSDPRMGVSGLLKYFIPIVGPVLDPLLDMLVGPIFCHLGAFSVADSKFPGLFEGSGEIRPGNATARSVVADGNPVPGQPGAPGWLTESMYPSDADLVVQPADPPVLVPNDDPPPAPTVYLPVLFGGDDQVITSPVEMCGQHVYDRLRIEAEVKVADVPGPLCDADLVGTLELAANILEVAPSGSVVADAVISTLPPAEPGQPIPDVAATGTAGGNNAGAGSAGTIGAPGLELLEDGFSDDRVTAGAPGASAPAGTSFPEVPVVTAAGPGGAGGGVVVLRADRSLVVEGRVTANGGDGASDTSGACDVDPFEDPSNDVDLNGNGVIDPDERVADDPPYEHDGFIGSGAGAGGGVLLDARQSLQVAAGAVVGVDGGNGGDGKLGVGGGGGGGVLKVRAAHLSIDPAAQLTASGGLAGAGGGLCDGVPSASGGTAQDGVVKVSPTAQAEVQPYWKPWWGTAGTSTLPVHLTALADPAAQIVICAIGIPLDQANNLTAATSLLHQGVPRYDGDGNVVPGAVMPSAAEPCGTAATVTSGSGAVQATAVQLGTARTTAPDLSEPLLAQALRAEVAVTTSGYYGLYVTTLSPRDGVRDCVANPSAADCVVEFAGGLDWVIGVDATAPVLTGVTPAEAGAIDAVLSGPRVKIGATIEDAESVAPGGGTGPIGIRPTLTCRVTPSGAAPDPAGWTVCAADAWLTLGADDGAYELEVRAKDHAGNLSVVHHRTLVVNSIPPTAQASFVGGVMGAGGWWTSAPGVQVHGYGSVTPAGPEPYAYRFNAGNELTCATNPCTIAGGTVGALNEGSHVFHYTGVDANGLRRRDGEAGFLPMHQLPFKLDQQAPQVALSTVPTTPDGPGWFSTSPYLVVNAVDRFGGSGLRPVDAGALQVSFDNGSSWATFDPMDPPRIPAGTYAVCGRAVDVAGNVAPKTCQTVRVDPDAPSFGLGASHGPDGAAGWYRSTAPSFTLTGYDDGAGFGPGVKRFGLRVDNGAALRCEPGCGVDLSSMDDGVHLVHGTAFDGLGNKASETTVEVKLDRQAPTVEPQVHLPAPDGANGWYHTKPYLVLAAHDTTSGLASVEYSLTGPAGPWLAYTGAVEVGAGGHTLCWRAADVAGNATTVGCQDLLVDLDDPTVDLQRPAPGANGWHAGPVVVTYAVADPSPGSTVDPAFKPDLSGLCTDLDVAPPAPSGTCVSVDGGPYQPVAGPITIGEGIHVVRSFAVDVAGRRGPVDEEIIKVDRSRPVISIRTLPQRESRGTWFRMKPMVVIGATDGEQASGVTSIEYRIGTGAWQPYVTPLILGDGVHNLQVRAADMIGTGTASRTIAVDTTPPKAVALHSSPALWLRLLGLVSAQLWFQVSDDQSGPLTTKVIIQDVTGNPVRAIDGPTINVVGGAAPVSAYVTWNGRDNTLTSLVPLGAYYWRVVATDAAGNVVHSGESKPLTIRLL